MNDTLDEEDVLIISCKIDLINLVFEETTFSQSFTINERATTSFSPTLHY